MIAKEMLENWADEKIILARKNGEYMWECEYCLGSGEYRTGVDEVMTCKCIALKEYD